MKIIQVLFLSFLFLSASHLFSQQKSNDSKSQIKSVNLFLSIHNKLNTNGYYNEYLEGAEGYGRISITGTTIAGYEQLIDRSVIGFGIGVTLQRFSHSIEYVSASKSEEILISEGTTFLKFNGTGGDALKTQSLNYRVSYDFLHKKKNLFIKPYVALSFMFDRKKFSQRNSAGNSWQYGTTDSDRSINDEIRSMTLQIPVGFSLFPDSKISFHLTYVHNLLSYYSGKTTVEKSSSFQGNQLENSVSENRYSGTNFDSGFIEQYGIFNLRVLFNVRFDQ